MGKRAEEYDVQEEGKWRIGTSGRSIKVGNGEWGAELMNAGYYKEEIMSGRDNLMRESQRLGSNT